MTAYTATVTRDGDDWLATCEQDATIHTFASTLAGLRREIADAILSSTDLPDDTVIPVHLVAGEGVSKEVARAIEVGNRRLELRQQENELRAETLAAVRSLTRQGWSVRDVAGAVGLTPGRVSQLA